MGDKLNGAGFSAAFPVALFAILGAAWLMV